MFALLAATWKRLLLLGLLAQLPFAVIFGVAFAAVHAGLVSPLALTPVSVVLGEFLAAWIWAASLIVLQARASGEQMAVWATVRAALRDWRQVLKLWALFVMLSSPYLAYTVYFAMTLDISAAPLLGHPVAELVFHYLSFAFILLPLAVLVERRGLARAFRLSHFSVRTAAVLIVWLVAGIAVDRALDFAEAVVPSAGATVALSFLIDIAMGVIGSVVIYAIFLRIRTAEKAREIATPAQAAVL
ncbi:hypothetical protein [Catelliglobosispora koreensis]|uniref:hypothetical protein n=1 Tax=Catelliglobosispora koreensis TaxID=129052 RepID=UPI00036679C6|nr:hypothetical protein [Catelliglobosispora koreensis]